MFRKSYLFLLCLLFSFSLSILNSSTRVLTVSSDKVINNRNVRIVIDCGHGGEDGGAVSEKGTVEKDINLEIGLTLQDLFSQAGFEVLMIRNTDKSIHDESAKTLKEKKISDIHNRSDICNSSPDNIYLSIHQNKFEESKYSGTQVFYSVNNTDSQPLAECIRIAVKGLLQRENERQCKSSDDNIYILSKAEVPAVLVECGFLSNSEEESKLLSETYRNQMAFAIYSGFLDFYNQNYR